MDLSNTDLVFNIKSLFSSIVLSLLIGRLIYLLKGMDIKPEIHLSIFEYSPEIDAWEDEDGTMRLTIKEITSANLTA